MLKTALVVRSGGIQHESVPQHGICLLDNRVHVGSSSRMEVEIGANTDCEIKIIRVSLCRDITPINVDLNGEICYGGEELFKVACDPDPLQGAAAVSVNHLIERGVVYARG